VEFSTGVNLFQYLFKYFFKSLDQANWAVRKQPSDPTIPISARKPVDEIRDYERGRYLSSIEAAMRLASFHISEKKPGVKRLPIHLPGRQYGQMSRKDGSESDATLLVRYMSRAQHPLNSVPNVASRNTTPKKTFTHSRFSRMNFQADLECGFAFTNPIM
jgi:hypothetical protein